MDWKSDTKRGWISNYYPGFDGLRGVAIFLVFLRHYGVLVVPAKIFYAGWVGVDLFFVLSGFLITGILYDTRNRADYYRNFYIRRALRILPLLYLLFGIAALLRHEGLIFYHRDLWSYALFFGNILLEFCNLAKHNPSVIRFALRGHTYQVSIGYLWSLCVEEQFYLLWPVLVYRLKRRETLMRLCAAVIIIVPLLRTYLFFFPLGQLAERGGSYSLLFTRIDTLLVGAWLALWLRGRQLSRRELRRAALSVGCSSLAILLAGVGFTIERYPTVSSNLFIQSVGFSLIAGVCASVLMLSLDADLIITRVLRVRLVATLGVISYGFYVLHNLPVEPMAYLIGSYTVRERAAVVVFYFFVVAALAYLSFTQFESRLLRLRTLLAPRPQGATDLPQQTGI